VKVVDLYGFWDHLVHAVCFVCTEHLLEEAGEVCIDLGAVVLGVVDLFMAFRTVLSLQPHEKREMRWNPDRSNALKSGLHDSQDNQQGNIMIDLRKGDYNR
jgi:hypothetical protein